MVSGETQQLPVSCSDAVVLSFCVRFQSFQSMLAGRHMRSSCFLHGGGFHVEQQLWKCAVFTVRLCLSTRHERLPPPHPVWNIEFHRSLPAEPRRCRKKRRRRFDWPDTAYSSRHITNTVGTVSQSVATSLNVPPVSLINIVQTVKTIYVSSILSRPSRSKPKVKYESV